jgi:hypothetical protein
MNEKKRVPVQHNCSEHLDRECRCELCGNVHHTIVRNSNGSGTGEVIEWCICCHKVIRYYDHTGAILESSVLFCDTPLPVENAKPFKLITPLTVLGAVIIFSNLLFWEYSDFLFARMDRAVFSLMGVYIILITVISILILYLLITGKFKQNKWKQ